eukprot:6190211-Pleurochrysis_carterae.AAC.1
MRSMSSAQVSRVAADHQHFLQSGHHAVDMLVVVLCEVLRFLFEWQMVKRTTTHQPGLRLIAPGPAP